MSFSSSFWSVKHKKVNETPRSYSKTGKSIRFNRFKSGPTPAIEDKRKPIQDVVPEKTEPLSKAQYILMLIQNGIPFLKPNTPTIGRGEIVSTSNKVRAAVIESETKKLEQFSIKESEEKEMLDRVNADMAKGNEPKPVQIGEEGNEMDVEENQQAALVSARRSEIDQQEAAAIKQILMGRSSNDIVIDKFNIDITVSKIVCLKPATWLNDEVVNFYMCMLQERDQKLCEASNGQRTPSHYFNSFFISKLMENRTYTYSNVKRWSKKFDVFKMNKIFMPVNLNNTHWVMAVVFVQKKEIHYIDSMSGSGDFYMKNILKWLVDEAMDKKKLTMDTSEWRLLNGVNVPQQKNGFDCGVFSIMCADYLSDDLLLTYSQEDMRDNRVKIAAAIKRGKLNY